jgi:hypothetical protein
MNKLALLVVAALSYFLSGCVTVNYRANPQFQVQGQHIRTVELLPPEVQVYQIDAGGVREEIEEWSNQARTNIIVAMQNELQNRTGMSLTIVDENSLEEEKALLEDTRALYNAVGLTILLHTYHPNTAYIFEEKLKNFDYSLGSEVQDLVEQGEALFLVNATDHVWTGGRQALQALGVILGVGASVATGVVIIPSLGGGTSLSAALVDSHTGDILWFNAVNHGAGTDLRNPESTKAFVSELFNGFPIGHDRKSYGESP